MSSQQAYWSLEPTAPDGRVWRVLTLVEPEPAEPPARARRAARRRSLLRWWRRPTAQVVDLREQRAARRSDLLPSDPDGVVQRLVRLREAGLITQAEYEAERRALRTRGSA
ncbi:MAG: hypothetical protein GC157_17105 [Frankiales bacterium]|nr:hypothetical protein [Frankiales bacterium]